MATTRRIDAAQTEPAHAGGPDIGAAAQEISQAAREMRDSVDQLTGLMQSLVKAMGKNAAPSTDSAPARPGAGRAGAATGVRVNIWEDDPFSEESATTNPPTSTPVVVDLPSNDNDLLQTRIAGNAPAPTIYSPGTAEFRYYAADEAIARGIDFWSPLLPTGTRWTTDAEPMNVTLVAGQDLNANYSRRFGLRFYEKTVRGTQFFSGESPDIVCHELGHAILDAVRPELFNAASMETAAFHEAFGDMSAMLSALQLPGFRRRVLDETQGRLNVNSRLSRVAEQLGWAIRQLSPTAVDDDSLRNAANRFFFQDPSDLPPIAPARQMSSEAHMFSRVFSGAFLDALARMLDVSGSADSQSLLDVSVAMGELLIDGVLLAPVVPNYYSEVAASMIQADQSRNGGRYRNALSTSFVERGILSPGAAAGLTAAQVPQKVTAAGRRQTTRAERSGNGIAAHPMLSMDGPRSDGYARTAADAPELPVHAVATTYGLTLQVHLPCEDPEFGVSPAAPSGVRSATRSPEKDAHLYVEDLIQLGRIDFGAVKGSTKGMVSLDFLPDDDHSKSKTTHRVETTADGQAILKRVRFDCGLRGCSCCR